jgi:hypothetical protein
MTILGPCRCQGCGRLVVLIRTMNGLKWLHRRRSGKPDTSQRIYWRTMKREARARMRAGEAGTGSQSPVPHS